MREHIRVLLVEDSPIQRRLSGLLAMGAGDMELTACGDGLEGLELAMTGEFHVLVLDLVLPGLSGLELLRRYRKGGGRAGVLVVSAAGGERARAAALAVGADLMLVKPVQWDELAFHIRVLAGGLAQQCQALLLEMGAKPRWFGLRQGARCAGELGEGRAVLIKEAYASAAAAEPCGMAEVEKNIRKMIQRLHGLRSPTYCRLMGPALGEKPPSNSEFLRLLGRAAAQGY